MAEVVLSDALVNDLSKKIDIALYPANEFAIHLGFDFAAASAAEQHSNQTLNPQGKYEHLLKKFVSNRGSGTEAAENLIEIFRSREKMDLVKLLEEALKKQNALKQSGLAKGQGQTGTGASARNKWIFVAGLVVVLLAIVVPCTLFPEPGKCASSPCQNEGICHELQGKHSCTCTTGYGGSNCETEYIAETFSLEDCQDTLRRHYEKHLFNIRTTPWDQYDDMDLEKLYTTVSLYKEDKNNIPDKPLQKLTLNGSANDIFQTKVRGSLPERIVLFGEAGRGKTTAVAKIAYDWANKKEDSPLKDVKLLFVFKMRNMNAKIGIAEAIVPLLGKKYKTYQKQLEDYIDSHEKDIVMLFDGYDEFSGKLQCRENIGDVIDILCQERCRRCRVLVTSRPVREEDFNSRYLYYSKMLIEGYSQQHATDFIDKFFISNETKGTQLKKYLEEDIVTSEMISTPLFCTMVCHLWNDSYSHGNFTRTILFDEIMKLLRKHLNAKEERDKEIKQDLLDDIVVSVGQVSFRKLSNKRDLNPLIFSEGDFSEVRDDKVDISYSLGLLTKNMKTDGDIHIEFFHMLAQEYSAGKYLASGLDDERFSLIGFSEKIMYFKEIFQFASGTSVSACRKILATLIEGFRLTTSSIDFHKHRVILDIISESGACAEKSETYLTSFFEDGFLRLPSIASTVVGFEKLPGSVKEKITTIFIYKRDSHRDVFVRVWNSMRTCIHLSHMVLFLDVPPTKSSQMKPLYTVNSLSTYIREPYIDDYLQIMMFLPNLRELRLTCDKFGDLSESGLTPDAFKKIWDQLNTSSVLSDLALPIPADIVFNLKHLTSIRVFRTTYVESVSSLAHVLTFLPKVRELINYEIELVDLENNTKAFCKLWENLHNLPDLRYLTTPIPAYREIPCDLEPLRSVQTFATNSSSIHLPILLIKLPNLQQLHLLSDIPGYPEVDVESAHKFFVDFWSALHSLCNLLHLRMSVPESVPASRLEPLQSVIMFQSNISSHMEVFPILLSRLPNILILDVSATNKYDSKIAEDAYYDKVVSAIIDGVVKNGVQLSSLNMTFDPRGDASNTVSRDTVNNFIQMLKTSCMMRTLDITSFNYCVFIETDLKEIIIAIIEITSIEVLRIDCSLHSEGDLLRFFYQKGTLLEEYQAINKSEEIESLNVTLFNRNPETNSGTEEHFFVKRYIQPEAP